VVPGSFPFVLAPEPEHTVGLRRLIIIDDNVQRIYGPQLEKVSIPDSTQQHRAPATPVVVCVCGDCSHVLT
jgi:hypothetical protein